MKLTKGKLSKIRNKKNQSAKRFKNTGKGRKTKTFRKRRALNLHNTSLKKYNGGQGAKTPENESKIIEPTKPDEVPATSVVVDEPVPPTTNVVDEPVPPTTNVVDEPVPPTTDVVDESVSPTTDVGNLEEGSGSFPVPVSEIGSEVSPLAKEEMVEDGPAVLDATPVSENEMDAASEIGSEDAASITEEPLAEKTEVPVEPTQQQLVGNDISIVAESLDKLAEYISDKIAKKINFNLGSVNSSTDLNRDSFNAVANANESLVQA
jgi:hypothetical protein